MDGYLNFYSVSGDGRVTNWTIVKTSLWFTDTLNITFTKSLHNFSEEDTKAILKDGGRCVAFNPNDDTMFLVGTGTNTTSHVKVQCAARNLKLSVLVTLPHTFVVKMAAKLKIHIPILYYR